MLTYLIPVILFALLCAGWAGVQLLARKMGTKNHIDSGYTCCGNCDKECWKE